MISRPSTRPVAGARECILLNTYDLPSRPLYNLTALTLHESAPGHAFQMPLALEHKHQPEFRQHTYLSAYGEGWALYCERLGLEMGMYETPYDRFGMLNYQIWRAARLVVDTGIHAQGWSRDRAIGYLRDYTALPEHEIETEVDRYIGWPAQALSYYLGEDAIVRGRAKAEAASVRASTFAPSTTQCSSSDPYRCRFWRRASIGSSAMGGGAPIPASGERKPVRVQSLWGTTCRR